MCGQADKKARAEKAARDKAIRAGQQPVDSSASSASVEVGTGGPARVAAAAAASSSVKGKDYPETRLQVRLSKGGPPMTKAFPSDAREFPLRRLGHALELPADPITAHH